MSPGDFFKKGKYFTARNTDRSSNVGGRLPCRSAIFAWANTKAEVLSCTAFTEKPYVALEASQKKNKMVKLSSVKMQSLTLIDPLPAFSKLNSCFEEPHYPNSVFVSIISSSTDDLALPNTLEVSDNILLLVDASISQECRGNFMESSTGSYRYPNIFSQPDSNTDSVTSSSIFFWSSPQLELQDCKSKFPLSRRFLTDRASALFPVFTKLST